VFKSIKKSLQKLLFCTKNLIFFPLCLNILISLNVTYSKSPEDLINKSIANYPGKCPCPYSIMSNGNKCGKRSAYSKPGGYEPLCYISDISGKENSKSNAASTLNIIKIIDGDTIHINKVKYRLHGIDAPEIRQICQINKKNYNCGIKSKEFLISLIDNRRVKCNKKDVDRYKRVVAKCFVGNTNLNKALVRNGWALAFKKYSKDYIADQEFAEENGLGIWKGTFIHPKEWRKLNR